VQYTLRADMGRLNVDVLHHTSDAETVSLPLQWAVDSAIIELISGVSVDPPNQQPFTKMTDEATKQKTRRSVSCNAFFFLVTLLIALRFPEQHTRTRRARILCRPNGCCLPRMS
jgi:hypothetical protein